MSARDHVWGENHARPADAAAVIELARQVPADLARPIVIGIDGRAGSGKSSLAQLVARALGDPPGVHLDDLFPGWDGLAAAAPLLTAQVLVPLARGEQAAYRRFDWHSSTFAELVEVPAAAFLVVEGCSATVGLARPYVDVRVWVEAGQATRMQRGLARDGDAFGPHWERWARQEDTLFAHDQTREHAHLVVRTDPG